jgi:hypothetical protein
VQEHIAYRVWSLGSGWEIPKEAAAGSSQGGLVYLKYTFKYKNQFDEPNNDRLDCIEATSDELLGAYTRAKDDAMTVAFGLRGKKRLNRVFDIIGFVYPYYCYPSRKQGKKRKSAASAIASSPKLKKVKVLMHRPKRSESDEVPKPAEGPSSTVELEYPALAEAKGESAEVPKPMVITEQEKTEMVEVPKRHAETKEKKAEKPEARRSAEQPKIMSLSQETELPKVSNIPVVTQKRKRMASVLDAVMESTKVLTPASAEVPNIGEKNAKETAEAVLTQAGTEAGSSVPAETVPTKVVEKNIKARPSDVTKTSKEFESPVAGASTEGLEFIVRHAAGKNY